MTFNLRRAVLLLLGFVLLVRLVAAATMELMPEEAYYWTYWQHPAAGYFDHPPMVAWVIGLGTALLGDTELGVRLGTILLWLGSSGLLYLLGRAWFDEPAALGAVGLLALSPIYIGTGLFAFPDGPLIFFWLASLVAMTYALRTGKWLWWILAGLAFGAALLSKYTAVLLAGSLGLFLLVTPSQRRWLLRPHPWIALVLGLAVFSPVIYWNAEHQWASFLFQTHRTIDQHSNPLVTVGDFWLMQLLILTPPLAILLAWAVGRALKTWREADQEAARFAVVFALPLFLVFVKASFQTEIHVNWTAPAFLSLLPLVAAHYTQLTGAVARRWRRTMITTGALCLAGMVIAFINFATGFPNGIWYRHIGGWRSVATEVERAEHALEAQTGKAPFILGMDKYNLAAELSFYTHEPEELINVYAVGEPGLGFRYWSELGAFAGAPAVVVLTKTNEHWLGELTAHFDRRDPPRLLEIPNSDRQPRRVYLMNAYDYRVEHQTSP